MYDMENGRNGVVVGRKSYFVGVSGSKFSSR